MSLDAALDAAPAPSDTAPTTAPGPSLRERVWRRRGVIAVVVGLLVVSVLAAVVATSDSRASLDIDSYSETGSRAIAALLEDQGTPVRQVRTVAEAAAVDDGVLVVVGAEILPAGAADALARTGASSVVLVGADRTEVVAPFVPGAEVSRVVEPATREPACALPAAAAAGTASVGGVTYDVGSDTAPAAACYPDGGEPSLIVVESPDRRLTLLGSAVPLQNDDLVREGNAALALNLIGDQGPVTWYLPSLEDLYSQDELDAARPFTELIPSAVTIGLVWVAVVVLVLAAWRARRLGPVVDEELPVVVRASETVEGRARLYRRAQDRGRAASILRAATRDRLADALDVPRGGAPETLVPVVAARSGRAPVDVGLLLYGAEPRDDAALVRLADDLDRLDREVRRP
jgi:hypothetical protein